MEKIVSINLDANETAFFARELEFIKARSYDVIYPELKAIQLIPVSSEAGQGAETITYQQFDQVGIAKIIANYADDLPRADIVGKEFTAKVRSIGASYGYSIQEIRAAQFANRNLVQRKANAARRANDQTVDRIGWKGDATHGLIGFLTNPNITAAEVQVGGTTATKVWSTKNPDEILKDLNDAVTDIVELTNGVEVPDTILLPIAQYAHIQKTRLAAGTDTTILQFFLANNPSITRVEWVTQLKGLDPLPSGDSGPKDVMVVYKRSPDKLTFEIPQAYEQFPAQERNLEFVIPVHSRCGGVLIYYPLSVSVVEGI